MELVYLSESKEIDRFLIKAASASRGGAEFLPSEEWGQILKEGGETVVRLGIRENGELSAVAALIKKPLAGLGQAYFYWYAPRGPIFLPAASELVRDFFWQEIKKLDCRAIFLRIEPGKLKTASKAAEFQLKKTISWQPAKTLLLDLKISSKDLLLAMSQKTRYNIRLAEKKGIRIIPGTKEDFPDFWRLMKQTGERDNFRLHGAKHYQDLLSAPPEFIRLFFAEFEGEKIAAGLFCFFGGRATYLHGASDNNFRQLMAPYLLQWEVIKQAQSEGCDYYDFYGVDEEKWPGVTRFKKGFGGEIKEYPGTFDVIFKPNLYRFYGMIRKIRRWL